jgi:hypothetical protein
MSKRKEFDPAKIEQAAALLKQAGYHVYPDQRVLTVEDAATINMWQIWARFSQTRKEGQMRACA